MGSVIGTARPDHTHEEVGCLSDWVPEIVKDSVDMKKRVRRRPHVLDEDYAYLSECESNGDADWATGPPKIALLWVSRRLRSTSVRKPPASGYGIPIYHLMALVLRSNPEAHTSRHGTRRNLTAIGGDFTVDIAQNARPNPTYASSL